MNFIISSYTKCLSSDNNISYGIDKELIKYIKCKDINYVIVDRECNIKVIECSNNNYYKYVIRESVIKILE